jgi:hypothetical protein
MRTLGSLATSCLYAAPIGILLLAVPLQVEASEASCSVLSKSDTVAIVICGKSTDKEVWRDAGLKACEGKTLCNAWIWDDRTKAPKTAPKTDADMSKSEASSARAIWIHDDQKLVLIRQVRQ